MNRFYGKDIYFRYVDASDAPFIHALRIDPELSRYLHPVEGGVDGQVRWIREYEKRRQQGLEHYFMICLLSGEEAGAIRIYDLRKDSFSWGSWVLKKGVPLFVSIESALMIYEIGFYNLGFEKCHFNAMKQNESVVKFHEGFGARLTGQDEQHNFYAIGRADFESAKKKYRRYYKEVTVQ